MRKAGEDSKCVLVIDPDEDSARWLEQCLRGLGYEVTVAWDKESSLLVYDDQFCAVMANMRSRITADAVGALREHGHRPLVIAFGPGASLVRKGTLVVLPMPMETRQVETAMDVVLGMRALPRLPAPRQMGVRPAA